MAYGASLESWLSESSRGFESPILRETPASTVGVLVYPREGIIVAICSKIQ